MVIFVQKIPESHVFRFFLGIEWWNHSANLVRYKVTLNQKMNSRCLQLFLSILTIPLNALYQPDAWFILIILAIYRKKLTVNLCWILQKSYNTWYIYVCFVLWFMVPFGACKDVILEFLSILRPFWSFKKILHTDSCFVLTASIEL